MCSQISPSLSETDYGPCLQCANIFIADLLAVCPSVRPFTVFVTCSLAARRQLFRCYLCHFVDLPLELWFPVKQSRW